MPRTSRRELDRPPLAWREAKRDQQDLVVGGGEAIEPLDGCHTRAVERVAQERLLIVRTRESVEVDVSERQAPAPVRGRDRERRAVDVRGVDPEAGGQAADETGLAHAQLADETEELPAPGRAAECGPERLGLLGAGGLDLNVAGSSAMRSPARRPTSP